MALTTGDILLYYPTGWTTIADIASPIGGTTGNNLVNSALTGLFSTGISGLPGGISYNRYAKVFFRHKGLSGDTLTNPQVYLTNLSATDQITIAPDPYWLKLNSAQTGFSANRVTIPNHLSTGFFSGYTIDTPLNLSSLSGSTVVLSSGQAIGLWIKMSIQAGLPGSPENTFSIALKGETS